MEMAGRLVADQWKIKGRPYQVVVLLAFRFFKQKVLFVKILRMKNFMKSRKTEQN